MKVKTAASPASLGYTMPAEWEPHEATWLAWPRNPTDWPDKLQTVKWAYTEIVRKITLGERVRLMVRSRDEERQARGFLSRPGVDTSRVDFVQHATDRSWTRDSGPLFVRRGVGRRSETAIVHFHFNAWAKYDDWRRDRRVPETAARFLKKRLFRALCRGRPFVLEGGGIDVNGRGTLLTTEECYLDTKVQVRNPGMDRSEIDETLKRYLGVKNVFWLVAGPAGDDTHGHIDDICRFVNARTVVLVRETNRMDPNYRSLSANWDRIQDLRLEDGSKPDVVPLPMPSALYFDKYRLPASYANFYMANSAVLVPTFNDPLDRVALGTIAELVTDRPVVGIHAVDLVLGFGTLHCLTQQQPV